MNRTKIDFADWTWNCITGCKGNCWYCYARAMYRRFGWSFEPQFHQDRLKEPLRLKAPDEKANRSRKPWIVKAFPDKWLIFACSVSDFFGPWNPPQSQCLTQRMMAEHPEHIFIVATKQYEELYPLSSNVWIGISVTSRLCVEETICLLKSRTGQCLKFIIFEPLQDRITCDLSGIDWIIIGRLTGPKRNSEHFNLDWVQSLIDQARSRNVPVFIKDNVSWPTRIQEFPKGMNE